MTGFYPKQGETELDQKPPQGPKDCPAGSWSHWDTFHFTSPDNGFQESRERFIISFRFLFDKKKNPDSRSTHDRKSPFSRYLWLSLERLDLVLLYKTRVTWHSEKAKTCVSSHLILFCLFAFFDFVFHLSELREDVLNLYIYIVLNWWYNQSWGENRRYLSLYVFNMQLILQTKSHVDTFTRLLSFVQTSQEKPYHWLEAILLQDWTIIS